MITNLLLLIALLLLAYIAGSINFSILVFKLLGKEDPRSAFSKNPGAFNVYRQAGKGWAAIVLILDMGRAAFISLLGLLVLPLQYLPWVALVLILGNRFPCFHGFRGGKGVGNYLGFTAVLSPLAVGLSMLVWLLIYKFAKEAFIGSFGMLAVLALGTMARCQWQPLAVAGTLATVGMIYFFHRTNVLQWLDKRRNAGRTNEA